MFVEHNDKAPAYIGKVHNALNMIPANDNVAVVVVFVGAIVTCICTFPFSVFISTVVACVCTPFSVGNGVFADVADIVGAGVACV